MVAGGREAEQDWGTGHKNLRGSKTGGTHLFLAGDQAVLKTSLLGDKEEKTLAFNCGNEAGKKKKTILARYGRNQEGRYLCEDRKRRN